MPAEPQPSRSFARGLATVLGTLLVVLGEFGLLTAVYHSGDGADRRHEAYVRLEGAVSAWAPGASTAPVADAAQRLHRVAGSDADRLQAAVRPWAQDPTPARLATMRERAFDLGGRLRSEQRFADWRAAGIHASLLALVSVGWFLWFRRVVRRHRDLEHTLTETRVAIAGERRLTALVRNSADLVLVLEPDCTISFASPSTRGVLGRRPEDLLHRPVMELVEENDVPLIAGLLANAGEGDHAVTLRTRHADGRPLVVEGTLTNLLGDEAVGGWVLTVRDVTERIQLQEELSYQALHDSLTGLANRRLFTDRLAHALRMRGGTVRPLAVVFLDLDDFKDINDSRGHAVGDRLLSVVAERLTATIRQGDTAARLGGDEFAVLMEDVDLETAREIAERVVAEVSRPYSLEHLELTVRASVGLATAVPGLASSEETLRHADLAMYWAKEWGKGTIAVYDPAVHAEAMERLELQAELAVAIREGQLRLHYQPNVDLGTGQILAFEALVRWQHPTRGLLPPGVFVPLAEDSGLVVPMGAWVLREACRAAAEELTVGVRAPDIAVNVAARQIADHGFVDLVLDTLATTGLDPGRLKLEITESTFLDDRDMVVEKLASLRERGIWVAVDDFGTGYSSLSYLADLPVDVLKVDKSFVDQICGEGGGLVDAIVGLADSLRLVTVAEGVERADQAARVRAAGCNVGQGYLWSRPVPLAEAAALLYDELVPTRYRALSGAFAGPNDDAELVGL